MQHVHADKEIFYGITRELSMEADGSGLLSGLTFVAKDLYDIAGYVTGAGNPDWKRTHSPAVSSAIAVQMLLGAGARLIGKSLTDELAFSLDGINAHYGTPTNVQFPGRIPGGSSSGSAAAVAAAIADFGLGTDTAGSIRVPAAYCGIYGLRPTHGLISTEGVVPLGPSFDTVGWCARTPEVLTRVAEALLPEPMPRSLLRTALIAEDCFELVAEGMGPELICKATALLEKVGLAVQAVRLPQGVLDDAVSAFHAIRGREAWRIHGRWITEAKPNLSAAIAERFRSCSMVSDVEVVAARKIRKQIADRVEHLLLREDCALVLPTVCGEPPLLDSLPEVLDANRKLNVKLNVIASLLGLPQLAIPVHTSRGCSSVSLVGRKAADKQLLRILAI